MDHTYNNNNKWRLHATFSDPRVWIKGGSTMDQRGSTWIKRLQPVPSACRRRLQPSACRRRPDSWLMRHASCVMAHSSCIESIQRPTRSASGVRRQASGSWLMRPTHVACVMRQTHGSCVRRQALDSWLMRQASHASGVESVRRHAFTSLIQPHSAAARCRS